MSPLFRDWNFGRRLIFRGKAAVEIKDDFLVRIRKQEGILLACFAFLYGNLEKQG
ncbi:MAG: hypothetical protein Q4D98_05955 [Planctomycetia bacterium]|nr:hypothetical protein [Planctomycetia bacterium]